MLNFVLFCACTNNQHDFLQTTTIWQNDSTLLASPNALSSTYWPQSASTPWRWLWAHLTKAGSTLPSFDAHGLLCLNFYIQVGGLGVALFCPVPVFGMLALSGMTLLGSEFDSVCLTPCVSHLLLHISHRGHGRSCPRLVSHSSWMRTVVCCRGAGSLRLPADRAQHGREHPAGDLDKGARHQPRQDSCSGSSATYQGTFKRLSDRTCT